MFQFECFTRGNWRAQTAGCLLTRYHGFVDMPGACEGQKMMSLSVSRKQKRVPVKSSWESWRRGVAPCGTEELLRSDIEARIRQLRQPRTSPRHTATFFFFSLQLRMLSMIQDVGRRGQRRSGTVPFLTFVLANCHKLAARIAARWDIKHAICAQR